MSNRIASPKVGTVVRSVDFDMDVLIIEGQYMSDGKVSNYWAFRPVNEDGSLGDIITAYGNFKEAEKEYSVETRVVCHSHNLNNKKMKTVDLQEMTKDLNISVRVTSEVNIPVPLDGGGKCQAMIDTLKDALEELKLNGASVKCEINVGR